MIEACIFAVVSSSLGGPPPLPHGPPRLPDGQLRYKRTAAEAKALADFRVGLQRFRVDEAGMPPERQASEWLQLYDRLFTVPEIASADTAFDSEVISDLLPPPPAWNEIQRLCQARYNGGDRSTKSALLLLLARVLHGDAKGEYALIKFQLAATPPKDQSRRSMWRQLYGSVALSNGDPEQYVWPTVFFAHSERADEGVALPALVTWLGAQKATPIIRDLVLATKVRALYCPDQAAAELAAHIAFQEIGRLRIPQWDLAATGYEPRLMSALERRFPVKHLSRDAYDPDKYDREEARAALQMREILEGRGDAVANELLLSRAPKAFTLPNPYYGHQGAKGDDAVYAFLAKVLRKCPRLEWWKDYVFYGEATGHLREMPELLRFGLKQRVVRETRGPTVRWALWEALVETGRIDDGLQVLYDNLSSGVVRPYGKDESSDEDLHALQIARIGQLTGRPAWVEKGLKLFRRFRPSAGSSLPDLLREPGTDRSDAPECLWARAQALDKAQLWTQAVEAYAAYLRVRPETYGCRTRLAYLLHMLGRRTEAEAEYEKAFRQIAHRRPDPTPSSDLEAPVNSFWGGFALTIAKRAFADVAAKEPGKAEPRYWLATALQYGQDYAAAGKEYAEALRLDPMCEGAEASLDRLSEDLDLHFRSAPDLDEAALRIARTDPTFRRQGGLGICGHDLRRLWAEFEKSLPPTDPSSLPPYPTTGQLSTPNGRPRTPAQAIALTDTVFEIAEQLGYAHRDLMDGP